MTDLNTAMYDSNNVKSHNLEKLQLCRKSYGGIHSTMRWVMMCSRVMGLLPISGLSYPHSNQLKYTLCSAYTIIYVFSMFGQFLMCFVSSYWFLEADLNLSDFTNAVFYTSSFTSSLVLVNVGRSWPKIVTQVEELESHLPPFSRDVGRVCIVTMFVILFGALIEHLLSVYYGLIVARSCCPENVAEAFFRSGSPWLFEYTDYSPWKAVFLKTFNIQSTFIWTFNDLLIMVISIYLTEHLIVHNDLLTNAVLQDHFSAATFRVQYLKIARLIKVVNGKIGIYILTSFGSNLYWICTQLFYSLNKDRTGHYATCHNNNSTYIQVRHSIEHAVYFIYSCSFLVTRTLTVLLLAARIHTNSKLPLVTLYGLPSERFSIEVERYIAQINNIKVALSGLDFFYVTRTTILTLFGTIVTYELVLLQFSK